MDYCPPNLFFKSYSSKEHWTIEIHNMFTDKKYHVHLQVLYNLARIMVIQNLSRGYKNLTKKSENISLSKVARTQLT